MLLLRRTALICALMLASCSRAPGLERLAPGETGRVAEVRSGDVLALDGGLIVRLAGIETPGRGDAYAEDSRVALMRLALGRKVQLLYGGARRDRYGRALAQVKLIDGGRWLQGALLRAGAARVRTWSDNRAMAAPMLEAEAYARNRRLGLWALQDDRVLIPSEAARADGFQIVEARVRALDLEGDDARLELGDGFSAVIDAKAIGDFETAGKWPRRLVGRVVRLRGPIRWGAGGPAMRLDHPEQVELLNG